MFQLSLSMLMVS